MNPALLPHVYFRDAARRDCAPAGGVGILGNKGRRRKAKGRRRKRKKAKERKGERQKVREFVVVLFVAGGWLPVIDRVCYVVKIAGKTIQ